MPAIITSLRLTTEELKRLAQLHPAGDSSKSLIFEVADAATAKALWGVVGWLEGKGITGAYDRGVLLATELRKAGIERPKP